MSVKDVIRGAVNVQKNIPGINMAHEDAPSSLNQLPCFVTYPFEGELIWPRPVMQEIITHDLNMDLYVQKAGEVQAVDRILKPYIDLVISTFNQNISLGGTCFNSGIIKYKYGTLTYSGIDYLGIKFILKVEERKNVIYKA